ncbi:hypothetical protein O9992_28560 [Vibrio lentus]|nr:hypothetical protein [Vibrio lentus]
MSTADWRRYHNYQDMRAKGRLSTSNEKHKYVALQADANTPVRYSALSCSRQDCLTLTK